MRVPDRQRRCIGYRLNIIGVRVWEDHCRVVAKDRHGNWEPIGPAYQLPVFVPQDPRGIDSNPLLHTAYQYDIEHPGSDLVEVLAQQKPFEQALLHDAERHANGSA